MKSDRRDSLFLAVRRTLRSGDWERAFERWSRARTPGSVAIARPIDRPSISEQPPAESVQTSRIWIASATRWRHELDVPGRGIAVKIVDEPFWWSYAPGLHAISNESAPDTYPTEGDIAVPELMNPGALIEAVSVREVSAATHLGRVVDVISATPNGEPPPLLAAGADRYEFVVDRELDLALRLSASVNGREFWSIEVTRLEVGTHFGAELFRLELPAGMTFVTPGS